MKNKVKMNEYEDAFIDEVSKYFHVVQTYTPSIFILCVEITTLNISF